MRCEICGIRPEDGATLYRQNAKGVTGVWRCKKHNMQVVDAEEAKLIDVLEQYNREDRTS